MMELQALFNCCPARVVEQEACWYQLKEAEAFRRLRPGSQQLLKKVLLGPSGIGRRHLALYDLHGVPALDGGRLNRIYEVESVRLGTDALKGALNQAGMEGGELDALLVCSCTGYLCPGLSSYLSERAGLRADAQLVDSVGQGCGAALPLLRQADALLAAGAEKVACVAVEICSAAFFIDDDPGVLISLCLFGDGASASLWSKEKGKACVDGFQTLHWPEQRETLRFANQEGKLKNVLAREVPEIAGRAVRQLYEQSGAVGQSILAHTGGKKVFEAIEREIPGSRLRESREILRNHGNMSSPSVMFVLEEWLKSSREKEAWMTSFGAGFTCHGARVRRSQRVRE